jgi:hypothetical protein
MKKKKIKHYDHKFNFLLTEIHRHKLYIISRHIFESRKPFELMENTRGSVLRKLIDAEFKRLNLKLPS